MPILTSKLRELVHDGWRLETARFSPDGERVFVVSESGESRIWNLHLGGVETFNRGVAHYKQKSKLSPDGTIVLTSGGGFGNVQLWKMATEQPLSQVFSA